MDKQFQYDVVIIGGGAAGLSAAVTLGRALRSVLVIDAGQPRNAPAAGVHGFLSRDGVSPLELLSIGREEVSTYGGAILQGTATSARALHPQSREPQFEVLLEDGTRVTARRLLLTTGLVDELPNVPGLREQWGHGVVHCPYCHGWEVRNRPIGVLASGPMAIHQALLFRQWSADITLFLNDAVTPTEEEWEKLAARSISVVEGAVREVDADSEGVTGVVLDSDRAFALGALVVGPRFAARSTVMTSLGLLTEEHPMGVGAALETDTRGATAVKGVWAAGNATDLFAQVISSAAGGAAAGAAINADLIDEETTAAVEARKNGFSAATEARITELVLGNKRHGLKTVLTPTLEHHAH
ncbi:NAD(P)/FAD-dependent oxidoreductase [Arthrobacter sp. H41]|uniref:NAD(P)/FAD-dependent oxidoreductase n=1 Tax=Arthrobacter sp. H41 TaxID=1312978 RepID=UPI0004B89989|nr:NAD(P)/FAD-dependent oxidoreductase [Arthrobacter sp. H41]